MPTEAHPLVSCIMPTADRRDSVARAVLQFLQQDYPARELVVVDDGAEPVEDLLPEDDRIRYLRLPRRRNVGSKRNLACEAARGELIAHWDDDDWMAAYRLSYQVRQLQEDDADICGLDRLVFLNAAEGRAWQYRYPRGARPWVAGGTLLYRKSLWARHRFPEIPRGEDTRFLWTLPPDVRLLTLKDADFYIARIHPGNTSPKRIHSARWHSHSLEHVRRLIGEDVWAEWLGAAAALTSHQGPAAPPPDLPTLLSSGYVPWDGWSISRSLARALSKWLEAARPARILECGGGTSTLVLALHAALHGAEVVSLEHDATHLAKTRSLLARFGLSKHVTLVHAPLAPVACEPGQKHLWYDAALSGVFDFVFVDGPPISHGRQATLFALRPHLAQHWVLWLKDGLREHEKECVQRWSRHLRFKSRLTTADPRGVWMLQAGTASVAAVKAPPRPAAVASGGPLVSCIMPTYNRRRYVPRAIEYFLRQDYPDRELIVVDDGSQPVKDLLPDDDRIRYLRLTRRQATGAKRNLGCEAARGEILMCWDDDDWYAPHRITLQIEPLLRDQADVTALQQCLLYAVHDDQFWEFGPRVHARMFFEQVIGGTLTFRAHLWRRGVRFPKSYLAEDAALLRLLLRHRARLEKLVNADAFIYIRHGTNSWRFQEGTFLGRSGWQAVGAPTFMSLEDLAFYRGLRAAPSSVHQPAAAR